MPDRSATLASFAELRDSLIQLKQDRTNYIKSQDVLVAYQKLCALLQELDGAGDANNSTTPDG